MTVVERQPWRRYVAAHRGDPDIEPRRDLCSRQADAFWVLRIYHQAQPPITK